MRVLVVSMVALSACGSFDPGLDPVPGSDAGCSALTNTSTPGGADGGVSYTAVDALEFPHSGIICLEAGQQYLVRVEPHALASFELSARGAQFDVVLQRGPSRVKATRVGGTWGAWAFAGKNPVTFIVSSVASGPSVFSYSLSLAALSGSMISPVALPDLRTGFGPIEPTVNPASAPLFTPAMAGDLPEFAIGLDRAVEEVLDDSKCDATPVLPERYVAVDLDAGMWKLTGSLGGPSYRVKAVRSDGGVLAAGMLNPLATIDLTLTTADRVAIGASRPMSLETCGFDGGLPPPLTGVANFYVR